MVKFDGTDGERIRKATGMAGTWTGEMTTEAEGYEDVPEYIKRYNPCAKNVHKFTFQAGLNIDSDTDYGQYTCRVTVREVDE